MAGFTAKVTGVSLVLSLGPSPSGSGSEPLSESSVAVFVASLTLVPSASALLL